MHASLRPHQEESIAKVRDAFKRGKRSVMLQMPTGAGKTVVAASIAEAAYERGKRIVFIVPRITLVEQTLDRWYAQGLHDIGVIQGYHAMTAMHRPIQVASAKTLARRVVEPFDLAIVDEAHERSQHLSRLMRDPEWSHTRWLGLSATPWSRGLGEDYEELIVGATTAGLIEDGYLSPFRVYAPSHPDLRGVRTVAGDYHEGDLSGAMQDEKLVGDVVEHWFRHGAPAGTLVFGVDRAHAASLRDRFVDAGVQCGYIDGNTPLDERAAMGRAFDARELPVIANCEVMTTGVDLDVRCISLCRPTKSEMRFVQIVGRGLRTAPGKESCLILDHADNHSRLGFVTDIQHDALDDGAPKQAVERKPREAPLPKECPSCSFLKPSGIRKCPACGFEARAPSDVEHADGDLVELDVKSRRKANKDASWPEKQRWIRSLRTIAQRRNRSDGWVNHAYRKKFGVWPNDPRVKGEPPAPEADPDVQSWVKSQDIAFAKKRRKQREAA